LIRGKGRDGNFRGQEKRKRKVKKRPGAPPEKKVVLGHSEFSSHKEKGEGALGGGNRPDQKKEVDL